MTNKTTESQMKKHIARNKMKEMVDDDSIWHFFIFTEIKAFNKGVVFGIGLTLVVFIVFSLIF